MGVHDYFFYLCGKSPRSWWNHFTLTLEVSVQLEAVNQWQVSTRTINLRPAPLASCSLPFQQGSYFSAWPSLPIRQSRFHLSIWRFLRSFVFGGGPWRRNCASSLLPSFIYCILSTRGPLRCFCLTFCRASVYPFLASGWNIWSQMPGVPIPAAGKSHILILLCQSTSEWCVLTNPMMCQLIKKCKANIFLLIQTQQIDGAPSFPGMFNVISVINLGFWSELCVQRLLTLWGRVYLLELEWKCQSLS